MNSISIKKMLENIKKDFEGMGMPSSINDDYIIDLLMKMYYQIVEYDWEEIRWLFESYMKTGTLDFTFAKMLGANRLSKLSKM